MERTMINESTSWRQYLSIIGITLLNLVFLILVDSFLLKQLAYDLFSGISFENIRQYKAFWFCYDVVRFAVFQLPGAILMLRLRPQKPFLFGVLSAFAFYLWLQVFHEGNLHRHLGLYHNALYLIWVILLPAIYWLLLWRQRRRAL